jgi:hypothetical protein
VHTGTTVEASPSSKQQQSPTNSELAAAPYDNLAGNSIHRASFFVDSANADQAHKVAKPSNSLSPSLTAALRSVGMTNEAFAGWETFHTCPDRAMLYFFIPITILLSTLCYLQFAGVPLNRLYFTIPCLSTVGLVACYILAVWRYGPAAARSRLYIATLPFSWIGWCTTFVIRLAHMPASTQRFESYPASIGLKWVGKAKAPSHRRGHMPINQTNRTCCMLQFSGAIGENAFPRRHHSLTHCSNRGSLLWNPEQQIGHAVHRAP